jgi:hypothetical protein
MSNEAGPILRASEVGEYTYCARAWWLKRAVGAQSSNTGALRRGQIAHDRHGQGVARAARQRRWALILLAGALVLALAALLLALAGGA